MRLASLRDAKSNLIPVRWCRSSLAQPPANRSEPSGFVPGHPGESGLSDMGHPSGFGNDPGHPGGMPAISRGLSGATPPVPGTKARDPGRGRSQPRIQTAIRFHTNLVLPVSNSCIMPCFRAWALVRRCSNAANSASRSVSPSAMAVCLPGNRTTTWFCWSRSF